MGLQSSSYEAWNSCFCPGVKHGSNWSVIVDGHYGIVTNCMASWIFILILVKKKIRVIKFGIMVLYGPSVVTYTSPGHRRVLQLAQFAEFLPFPSFCQLYGYLKCSDYISLLLFQCRAATYTCLHFPPEMILQKQIVFYQRQGWPPLFPINLRL